MSSQKPWGEMFATSTAEVRLPGFADFVFMFFYEAKRGVELARFKAIVFREFNIGLEPKLCFAFGCLHVYMHSNFFAREEVEAVWSVTENGWASQVDCWQKAVA
jgi:hypothetical protein